MASNRLQNSIKNIASGFVSRFLIIILGMIVRTVFIKTLGNEYLSVNGLYSNILNMLSLTEMGFSTAMIYAMYKPLAENNYEKIASLMALYKKVYTIVGIVISLLGLCVIPFMDYIIKDPPNISYLTFYYILFLSNSAISYLFFAYKRSIIIADQKEYICNFYHNIANLTKSIFQIIFLLVFRNFTLYLVIQILFTFFENLFIARYSDKKYNAFKNKKVVPLLKEEKHEIWKNVKAMLISRLGHLLLNSTDNIIISAFVGLSWVGLLSNFTLIVDAVTGVLSQITHSITASVGNFFVKNEKKDGYDLFKKIDFMNFWLYGFSTVALIILLNPFITIWLGSKYALNFATVVAIAINFFVAGFMSTLWMFRTTLGLFSQGQYRPLIVAFLNIFFSIMFSFKFGLTGVLAATALSRAAVNLWYDPWIIHKKGFQISVKPFFKKYFIRIVLLVLIIFALHIISTKVVFSAGITFVSFLIMMIIVAVVPNVIFVFIYCKTSEFKYLLSVFKKISSKFVK